MEAFFITNVVPLFIVMHGFYHTVIFDNYFTTLPVAMNCFHDILTDAWIKQISDEKSIRNLYITSNVTKCSKSYSCYPNGELFSGSASLNIFQYGEKFRKQNETSRIMLEATNPLKSPELSVMRNSFQRFYPTVSVNEYTKIFLWSMLIKFCYIHLIGICNCWRQIRS